MRILPSIYSSNILNVEEELKFVEKYFDTVHIDIQDGVYVKELTFGPKMLKLISQGCSLKLSIHYMVKDPIDYIDNLSWLPKDRTDVIYLHLEQTDNPVEVLERYIKSGFNIGLAISNRNTYEQIQPLLERVKDVIVITTSLDDEKNQSYLPSMEEMILKIKANGSQRVCADGGIKIQMIENLKAIGVDGVVMGRAIFNEKDKVENLLDL